MGAGMDKILPGLYVGSIRDSKDLEQINKNNITHILSIHDDARDGSIQNIKYLCFKASDNASQDIKSFFEQAIDFIHNARLNNGNVLVHCLAGISRSTSLAISYIMTITEIPWYDSLNVVRAARKGANPNFGFQRQLQNFEYTTLKNVRENLYKKYGTYDNTFDLIHCKALLENYNQTQKSFQENTSNLQMNCNAIKTYPLKFNAYSMDEDNTKEKNLDKNSPETTDKNETQTNEEEIKIDKEKFLKKLFD